MQKRYAMAHKSLKEKYDEHDPLKFSVTMAVALGFSGLVNTTSVKRSQSSGKGRYN